MAGWWIFPTIFAWGYQKCKFYQRRTHPADAKLLPMQPMYRLGYRLCGQKFSVDVVCLIKPVWNGFQTISARWHEISYWYAISDYVHSSISDFYHVAELFYSQFSPFSDTLWDSLWLLQTHSYSFRLIQTHSRSFRFIHAHSDSFRLIQTLSDSLTTNQTHWDSSRLINNKHDWRLQSKSARFRYYV